MEQLKTKKGSIILNEKQIDYFIQTNGVNYTDLQVRRARHSVNEKDYDYSFIFFEGDEGKIECENKFPGLLKLLAKRFPEFDLALNEKSNQNQQGFNF
jgi:hypothetical protein